MYKLANSLIYCGEGTLTLSKNILSLDYGTFKVLVKLASKGVKIAKTKVRTKGSVVRVTTESGRDIKIKHDGTLLLDGDTFKYSTLTVSFQDNVVYRLVPDKDIINLVNGGKTVLVLKLEDSLRLRKSRLVNLQNEGECVEMLEDGKPILQVAGDYLVYNKKHYAIA